jgi:hypothetical protein
MTNAHLSSVEAPSGEWSPAFPSQREPFAPDNRAAMTHGSYARLSDEPETQRIADDVRDSLAPYARRAPSGIAWVVIVDPTATPP